MRTKALRVVLLLTLLLSWSVRASASEALSLAEFGKKHQVLVSFDPLTACGQLEQRGVFVSLPRANPI